VRSSAQATDSQTYLFGYSYNLFGMTAMRYPSTRLLSYGYDAAGRVNQVGSYATGIQYAAHGAVSQMTLGNGVVETTSYNSRLQTISIASGTLFQIGYGYGTSASSNNGNLISQTITAAGHTFNQSYTYDQFNRVASAAEGSNWTRAFGYDRWGNMWVVSGSGVPIDSFTARDPSAYNAQNRRTDVGYDAAGNQTAIGGYTWAYDAEGHLRTSTINGAAATYYYDGEGRRVKRVLPVGTTVYVYDAGGNLAAEYGYAEPGAPCTTGYLTADHLGSTRMLAAQSGSQTLGDPDYIVRSLHDFIPFGEEVQAGIGGRSSTYYPGQPLAINDGTTIKFTGKEREGANGGWLDYFGARYYASVQGRFTSPDPLFMAEERIRDPQQWNLYAYARNNPLRMIDPTGLQNQESQPEQVINCGENDTSDACMEQYQGVTNTVVGRDSEHEGPFSLLQDWADVIGVKVGVGIMEGGSWQFGSTENRFGLTVANFGIKTGLGGGGFDWISESGFATSVSTGSAGVEVKASAQMSGQGGAEVELKAGAKLGSLSEFLRFSTTRFISRSLTLLSIGTAPSEQYTFSSSHRPRT